MSGTPTPPRGRWGRIGGDPDRRPPRRETRLLVVDDSPSARKLLQAILLRLGYTLPELRMATTPDEALRMFVDWRPETVIVDVELRAPAPVGSAGKDPGSERTPRDGIGLATEFLARSPNLRIVLCSATDPGDPRIQGLLADRRAQFVTKPVVASRIQAVLEAPGAGPRPAALDD
ncbi:MAG: response regulator [Thermoplasmata archaeon]|nr:response regulator [Thermoplasmata archaeon]